MSDLEKLAVTIFGGILTIAVISVIVGRNSKAPAAISAFGAALSSVVGAAVDPKSIGSSGVSSSSNNGSNVFSASLAGAESALSSGITSGIGSMFS